MTNFEIYVFILCLIVFVLLTALSIFSIVLICKMYMKLVRVGAEDEKLIAEDEKLKNKKSNKFSKTFENILTFVFVAILAVIFSGSIYINCTQNTYFADVPTYRVVKTASMSKKNPKNTYLAQNGLNDQIQTFDLILTYKIPKEEELKLYDIVVYEVDEMLIVHRIVGIEEPNEKHPDERYFLLQGDAVEAADRFPVTYSQMQGIYRGEKIPYIGSFVLFMQSPAGWLCLLLVVFAVVATPILEKKIGKVKAERLQGCIAKINEFDSEEIGIDKKELQESAQDDNIAVIIAEQIESVKDVRVNEEKVKTAPIQQMVEVGAGQADIAKTEDNLQRAEDYENKI